MGVVTSTAPNSTHAVANSDARANASLALTCGEGCLRTNQKFPDSCISWGMHLMGVCLMGPVHLMGVYLMGMYPARTPPKSHRLHPPDPILLFIMVISRAGTMLRVKAFPRISARKLIRARYIQRDRKIAAANKKADTAMRKARKALDRAQRPGPHAN
jgi:hypothetical protein